MNRKICLVTGSRADYGLQKKLIQLIKSDPQIQLQIIATGSHLSSKLGFTYKEIEDDGFKIDYMIEILGNEFNSQSTSLAISRAQNEIVKIMMITSSGAEGISLRNVRYVHIMEPYWQPVRIEQVIGRARRICSHNDLKDEKRKTPYKIRIQLLQVIV